MTAKLDVKVGLSDDFLDSLTRVPKKMQSKVLAFVNKFRTDPTSSGINYEKIAVAKCQHLHSVRIDLDYRAIVLKPETGNVYMLLWVDHHDQAYDWASRKQIRVHPTTGTLQVYESLHHDGAGGGETKAAVTAVSGNAMPSASNAGPFAGLRDRELLRLGVPEEQIAIVRGVATEADLDLLSHNLPREAYEGLFYILAGDTYEEALRNIDSPLVIEDEAQDEPGVDTEDFAAALDKPETRRKFYVVENESELAEVLNAPLEKWRVFLHPLQRKLVERNWNGPVRVLGGAGCGKTVAAIHRARWLVENVFTDESDRVLFTTFTRNLAEDIRENLRSICNPDTMKRIEVVNLDRWILNFLKHKGYNYTVDYGEKTCDLWEKAMDLAPNDGSLEYSFFREEWERVVQPQGIETLQQYMRASRVGRGTRLSAAQRKAVWAVFEEYRALLDERHLREPEDALRDARAILSSDGSRLPYRTVIVDEAQDMGRQAFELLRAIVPEGANDMFIVGDAHQRIYRHKVVLGRCGINVQGRSRKLKVNYRTTDETRKWAERLLTGVCFDDLDGGTDSNRGYKSLTHGATPTVRPFGSFKEESDFIVNYVKEANGQDGHYKGVCLVCRTNELLKEYEAILKYNDIPFYLVKRNGPEDRSVPGVRLATMHRVKGLEFDHMIICGVNKGIVPLENKHTRTSDETVAGDLETGEKALLYVAATRARKEVVVTSHGEMSGLISRQSQG